MICRITKEASRKALSTNKVTEKSQWCNFETPVKSRSKDQTRYWSMSKLGKEKAENHRKETKNNSD